MNKNQFVQITRRNKIAEKEFSTKISEMYNFIWENLLPQQIPTTDLPHEVAKNVITPPDAPIPDCQTCGGCCSCFPHIGVRPAENVPAENYWDITAKGENGEIVVDRFLKRSEETLVCKALEGKIGEKVKCGIYESRPQICRAFEAGSDKCHAVRRAYGLEPPLSLVEMAVALKKLRAIPEPAIVPAKTIKDVKIREAADSGRWEITALLEDGTLRSLHTYDPNRETYRQFEFSGMTVSNAQDLIASRKA